MENKTKAILAENIVNALRPFVGRDAPFRVAQDPVNWNMQIAQRLADDNHVHMTPHDIALTIIKALNERGKETPQ